MLFTKKKNKYLIVKNLFPALRIFSENNQKNKNKKT